MKWIVITCNSMVEYPASLFFRFSVFFWNSYLPLFLPSLTFQDGWPKQQSGHDDHDSLEVWFVLIVFLVMFAIGSLVSSFLILFYLKLFVYRCWGMSAHA